LRSSRVAIWGNQSEKQKGAMSQK
jgi:hypothetical protein